MGFQLDALLPSQKIQIKNDSLKLADDSKNKAADFHRVFDRERQSAQNRKPEIDQDTLPNTHRSRPVVSNKEPASATNTTTTSVSNADKFHLVKKTSADETVDTMSQQYANAETVLSNPDILEQDSESVDFVAANVTAEASVDVNDMVNEIEDNAESLNFMMNRLSALSEFSGVQNELQEAPGISPLVTDMTSVKLGGGLHRDGGHITGLTGVGGLVLDDNGEHLHAKGMLSTPLNAAMALMNNTKGADVTSTQMLEGGDLEMNIASDKNLGMLDKLSISTGQNKTDLSLAAFVEAASEEQLLDKSIPSDTKNIATPLTKLGGADMFLSSTSGRVHVPVNVTFGQPQWAGAIADRTAMLASQKISFAELQLDPPELGPLTVKIQVNHDQATVSFVAHSPLVKDSLDQSNQRLKEMFEQQGLNLVDVDVSERQEGGDGSSEGDGSGLMSNNANALESDDVDSIASYQIKVESGVDDFA